MGFRTLATNRVDKPVLNFSHGRHAARRQSKNAERRRCPTRRDARGGRPPASHDRGLATSSGHGMTVMVWNYQDEDVSGPPAAIDLKLEGLPKISRGC